MSQPPKPSVIAPTEGEKFNLRFPAGMREQIAAAARQNGRSMNTEIVTRLAASFDRQGGAVDRELSAIRRELAQLRELVEKRR